MRRVLRAAIAAIPYLAVLLCPPAALIWIFGLPGKAEWWEMALWLSGFTIVTHYPIVVLLLGTLAWRARRRNDTARANTLHRCAWMAFLILLLPLAPVAWMLASL